MAWFERIIHLFKKEEASKPEIAAPATTQAEPIALSSQERAMNLLHAIDELTPEYSAKLDTAITGLAGSFGKNPNNTGQKKGSSGQFKS